MKSVFQENSASVLVIEDNPAISKLIRLNLEDKDTQVIEVASGSDGVKILEEAKIDLLLLDLALPDSGGWDILDHLRATGSLNDLPVIVVSAEPPNTNLIERFKLNDYFQKPFDMRDLVARAREIIGLRDNIQCPA